MINTLLEERLFTSQELTTNNYNDLLSLRKGLGDRYNWRLTTENYDQKKCIYLRENEEILNTIITDLFVRGEKDLIITCDDGEKILNIEDFK